MSRTCAGPGPPTASEMSDETTHPDPREESSMLLYDDTAAEALHAAADEARRLGATKYETGQVLLGLLRTADPVTGTVTVTIPSSSSAPPAPLGAPPPAVPPRTATPRRRAAGRRRRPRLSSAGPPGS